MVNQLQETKLVFETIFKDDILTLMFLMTILLYFSGIFLEYILYKTIAFFIATPLFILIICNVYYRLGRDKALD